MNFLSKCRTGFQPVCGESALRKQADVTSAHGELTLRGQTGWTRSEAFWKKATTIGRVNPVLLLLALLLTGCGKPIEKLTPDGLRIIAMAPSIAETLYALGLSNEVVGVSRFTAYPPDTLNKPVVGGLYDPNLEKIITLHPTLVIGLSTQQELATQLNSLGIDFLGVSHGSIDDILQSILTIGSACGAESEATSLESHLRDQSVRLTEPVTQRTDPPFRKPRVLVCVGHDDSLSRLYVAARGTFYDELIERIGGVNACEGTTIKYPEISPEGLTAMKPDIVIDIVPNLEKNRDLFLEKWSPFCKKVTILSHDYATLPGPRFILLLDDFAQIISPKKKP